MPKIGDETGILVYLVERPSPDQIAITTYRYIRHNDVDRVRTVAAWMDRR